MNNSRKRLQPEVKPTLVHPSMILISDLDPNKVKAGLQVNDDTESILEELVATANAAFELLQNHEEIPLMAKTAFWQLQKQFNIYSALLMP